MQTYLPKWEQKLPKIPIIVFQIHCTLMTMENGVGLVPRNVRKLETKMPKPDAEKFTKKVTKTAKYPYKYASSSSKTSNPWKAEGKMPTNISKFYLI